MLSKVNFQLQRVESDMKKKNKFKNNMLNTVTSPSNRIDDSIMMASLNQSNIIEETTDTLDFLDK